jgi:molybdenum cofactor cytidylyltransferase
MENKTAIIILAAGNSSRLGKPKQLLHYKGKTLLRHTADEASSVTAKVIVVTGAEDSQITEQIAGFHHLPNEHWAEGMASSLKTGLHETLQLFPETEQFIFTVCDQPFISAAVFNALIEKKNTSPKGIIALCRYAGCPGAFQQFICKRIIQLKRSGGSPETDPAA